MSLINHINNAGTNLTSNQPSGVTTTPINSVPSISAPFYAVLDATNVNGHYEVVLVTGKTATNINHAATSYAHTTAEEVRFALVAAEADALWDHSSTGWVAFPSSITLTYSSADDPTYVVSTSSDLSSYIQKGDRIKFTNNSTTFYGIVTAIDSTTMTLYGGTDYDVANSAITAPYFSHMKSPYGFPMDTTKWSVTTTDTSDRQQTSPSQNTWYNLGSVNIVIPIGSWKTSYQCAPSPLYNTSTSVNQYVTLSTANNSESDSDFTVFSYSSGASGNIRHDMPIFREKFLSLASKTTYYLNSKTDNASQTQLNLRNSIQKTIIRAVCAYL